MLKMQFITEMVTIMMDILCEWSFHVEAVGVMVVDMAVDVMVVIVVAVDMEEGREVLVVAEEEEEGDLVTVEEGAVELLHEDQSIEFWFLVRNEHGFIE